MALKFLERYRRRQPPCKEHDRIQRLHVRGRMAARGLSRVIRLCAGARLTCTASTASAEGRTM